MNGQTGGPGEVVSVQWPAPARVQAVCTTRSGGVSAPPYDSFNLGAHVGDSVQAVRANREALAHRLGAHPVFLQQVHGHAIAPLAPDTPDGVVADAAWTQHTGLACCAMVADCLPLLVTDRQGSFVAALHAGWRGLSGAGAMQGVGVLEAFAAHFGACADWLVWLGPCIGPTAFEVGEDVRQAFVSPDPLAAQHFVPRGAGKWLADLPALARLRLGALGIDAIYGNDSSTDWCTFSQPSRFFSHRRDRVSGRQTAAIWRV